MLVSKDSKTNKTLKVTDSEVAGTTYGEWFFNYSKICVAWFIIYLFGYYNASFTWVMILLSLLVLRDKRAKKKQVKFDIARYIVNADENEILQEIQKLPSLPSWIAPIHEQLLEEKAKEIEALSQQTDFEEFLENLGKEKKDEDKLQKEISNKSQLMCGSTQTSNLSDEISTLEEKLEEASSQLTEAKEKITSLELSKKNLETELSASNSSTSENVITDLNTQLAEKENQIKNLESEMSELESSLKTEIMSRAQSVSLNKALQKAQDKHQEEKQVLQDKVTTLEGNVSNASLAASKSASQIAALEAKIRTLEEIRKKLEDQVSEYILQTTQQISNLNIKLRDKPSSEDDMFGSDDDWVPSPEALRPVYTPTRSTRSTRKTQTKSRKMKDDIFNPHLDQENKNKEKLLLHNKDKSKSAVKTQVLQETNNINSKNISSKICEVHLERNIEHLVKHLGVGQPIRINKLHEKSRQQNMVSSKAEESQESDHDLQNSSRMSSGSGVKAGKQKRRLYKSNIDKPFECEPNMMEFPEVSPHSVVRRQLRTKKK